MPSCKTYYDFRITIEQSYSNFINLGLVDFALRSRSNKSTKEHVISSSTSNLSNLRPYPDSLHAHYGLNDPDIVSGAENNADNPSTGLMLACRRGRKWTGHGKTKELYHDDICAGSTLNFRVRFSPFHRIFHY